MARETLGSNPGPPVQADDNSTRPAEAVFGPIDIRNAALTVIAALAVVFALRWAQAVAVPIVFSLLVSYSLMPIVNLLVRAWIPRAVGAAVLMAMIVIALGSVSYTLRDNAVSILEQIPQAIHTVSHSIRQTTTGRAGTVEKVQRAADEIQKAAAEASGADNKSTTSTAPPQDQQPTINLRKFVWGSTVGALTAASQGVLTIFLVYFFLVSGDLYKRKLVKITTTLTRKKITVQILDNINLQVQRYLGVLLISTIFVGLFTWLAFLWIGFEHAVFWGVAAGVLSAIPYVGPAIVFATTGILALVQFDSVMAGLGVAVTSLVITSIQGFWLMPQLAGHSARMNTAVIFVGLVFWSWMWGAPGLLLATPLMMIIKVVCDHVENLRTVGELLGD